MNKVQMLEKFYEKNFQDLCKKLGRLFDTFHDTEDAVQEAFVRALTYIDSFDPKRGEISVWFNAILRNAVRDKKKEIRLKGMSQEIVEDDAIITEENDLTDIYVKSKIDAYKGKNKRILELYFLKNYSPADIQAVTDMSYKAIETALQRFKKELREDDI